MKHYVLFNCRLSAFHILKALPNHFSSKTTSTSRPFFKYSVSCVSYAGFTMKDNSLNHVELCWDELSRKVLEKNSVLTYWINDELFICKWFKSYFTISKTRIRQLMTVLAFQCCNRHCKLRIWLYSHIRRCSSVGSAAFTSIVWE